MEYYMPKYIKNVDSLDKALMDIALYNIDGMSEEEARNFLMNDAIPEMGSVKKMFYYSETEPFAVEFYEEILEELKDVYGKDIPYEAVKSLNNVAWAAWGVKVLGNEEFIDRVIEKAKELDLLDIGKNENMKENIDDDEHLIDILFEIAENEEMRRENNDEDEVNDKDENEEIKKSVKRKTKKTKSPKP